LIGGTPQVGRHVKKGSSGRREGRRHGAWCCPVCLRVRCPPCVCAMQPYARTIGITRVGEEGRAHVLRCRASRARASHVPF
jgi:hypothetical protein